MAETASSNSDVAETSRSASVSSEGMSAAEPAIAPAKEGLSIELEDAEEKEEVITPGYNTKAFVIDKAQLRKKEAVEKIVAKYPNDAAKQSSEIKGGFFSRLFRDFFGEKLDSKSKTFNFYIPLKADLSKSVGEPSWIPVKVDTEDKTPGVADSLSKLQMQEGFIDSQKIKITDKNLNGGKVITTNTETMIAGLMTRDKIFENKKGKERDVAKISESRSERKTANAEMKEEEKEGEEQGNEIEKTLFSKAYSALNKIAPIGLKVANRMIIPKGLIFDVFGSVKIGEQNLTFTTNFKGDTETGDIFILGFKLDQTIKIGYNKDGYLNFAGEISGIEVDTSNSTLVFKASAASISAKILNSAEFTIATSNVSFTLENGIKVSCNIDTAAAVINVYGTDVSLSLNPSELKDNQFTFKGARANISELSFADGALKLNNTNIGLDENYNVTADTTFLAQNIRFGSQFIIKEFDGKLNAEWKKPDFSMQLLDSNISAEIFGQDLDVTGLNIESKSKIGFESVKLTAGIASKTFEIAVEGGKLEAGKFDFDKASVKVDKLDFLNESLVLENNELSLSKTDGARELGIKSSITAKSLNAGEIIAIGSASGNIEVKINNLDDFSINISEGKISDAAILGQKTSIDGITYNSDGLSASEAKMDLKIGENESKLNIKKPKIFNKKFSFEEASYKMAELSLAKGALVIKEVDVLAKANPEFSIKGSTNIAGKIAPDLIPGVNNLAASGTLLFDFNRTAGLSLAFENGNINGDIFGHELNIEGLNIKSDEVSATKAGLNLHFFGQNVVSSITSPSFKNGKFNFTQIDVGLLNRISIIDGVLEVDNPSLSISKELSELGNSGYKIGGSGKFLFNSSIVSGEFSPVLVFGTFGQLKENSKAGFSFESLSGLLKTPIGDLSVENLRKEGDDLKADSGRLTSRLGTGFLSSYVSNDDGKSILDDLGKLASASVDLTATNITINRTGFKTEKVDTSLNEIEVNLMGFNLKYNPKEKKGSLTKEVNFPQVVTNAIPNLRLEFPIFPPLNAYIEAGIGSEGKSNLTITVTKLGKDEYALVLELGASGTRIFVFIGAGVSVGIPFLASASVGVRAEGGVNAEKANITSNSKFNFNKGYIPSITEADLNFDLEAKATLEAKLVLSFRALFLTKEFTKTIAQKDLGSFTKQKAYKWNLKEPEAKGDKEVKFAPKPMIEGNAGSKDEINASIEQYNQTKELGDKIKAKINFSELERLSKGTGSALSADERSANLNRHFASLRSYDNVKLLVGATIGKSDDTTNETIYSFINKYNSIKDSPTIRELVDNDIANFKNTQRKKSEIFAAARDVKKATKPYTATFSSPNQTEAQALKEATKTFITVYDANKDALGE